MGNLFHAPGIFAEVRKKVIQFYFQVGSIIETKCKYRSILDPENISSSGTISGLTQNFIAAGTSEQLVTGRKPIVSDDKIATVEGIHIGENPNDLRPLSCRCLTQQVNLSRSATQMILRKEDTETSPTQDSRIATVAYMFLYNIFRYIST